MIKFQSLPRQKRQAIREEVLRLYAETDYSYGEIAEEIFNIPVRKKIWCQTVKDLHAKDSARCTVAELCGLFGKSKQAYYKHDRDADLRRLAQEEFALEYIRQVRGKDPEMGDYNLPSFGLRTHLYRDNILISRCFLSS